MAGLIRAEDIAAVKERTSIVEVVRDHVSLRSAGIGALKGLCPFHDEKTASFTVRESTGTFHCFGCGEGGDVVAFVQKIDHLSFVEAVERLAQRAGMELVREDGPADPAMSLGRRSRLVEAHRIVQEFYADKLVSSPEARAARDFLRQRDFGRADAEQFGVGFSPRGQDEVARLLRGRGFSEEEMTLAGLVGRGSRGTYDRFRGRLMWPIRDTSGDTIGFGARRLFDDDFQQAKYLNTTETTIYKKSQVLYGIDLAKKAIASGRQAVIVEGYTDVMAAQLSGVPTAVATCGTSFGVDHIKLLRRLMRDEPGLDPARIVFTFDGDAAGQKAAMRAFAEDQRWTAQSFVAVAGEGMDPCDLRLRKGADAVRHLVEDAVPMFEFAIRNLMSHYDLDTAEGRVGAMKAVAPVINSVKDPTLRPEYVRTVAGWIGVDMQQLSDQARRVGTLAPPTDRPSPRGPEVAEADAAPVVPTPDLRDPVVNAESQLLRVFIQYPNVITEAMLTEISAEAFAAPAHRAIYVAIRGVVVTEGMTLAQWVDAITTNAPLAVQPLVSAMAVADLPVHQADHGPDARYVDSLVARVQEVAINREIDDARSLLQRLYTGEGDAEQGRSVQIRLQDLQRRLAALKEGIT